MINGIDLGILFVLLLSGLIGLSRGVTREVLGLGCWIGAGITGYYGYPLLKPFLAPHIETPILLDGAALGIVSLISLIILILLSRSISATIKGSTLGGLDRTLGLVFGFGRGGILLCIGYLGLGFFMKPGAEPEVMKESKSLPLIANGANQLKAFFPATFQSQIKDPLQKDSKKGPLSDADVLKLAQPQIQMPDHLKNHFEEKMKEEGAALQEKWTEFKRESEDDLEKLLATHGGSE